MRQRTKVGGAATGVLAAGLVVAALAPASGAESGGRTLELMAVAPQCTTVDNGATGRSVGDLDACSAALRTARGAHAGRARWTCVYLGSPSSGAECSATVTLAGGTLELAGLLSYVKETSIWAVTGGTGRHVGARGSVRLRESGNRVLTTFTLLSGA